jgi:hypothetical protein
VSSVSVTKLGRCRWTTSRASVSARSTRTHARACNSPATSCGAERRGNRQIFMLTDGKPSALTEPDGEVYKNPFGLDRRVVAKTIEEAVVCRRHGIPITTFMLTEDPVLVRFVEEFTEANKGRAYFAGGDRLGAHGVGGLPPQPALAGTLTQPTSLRPVHDHDAALRPHEGLRPGPRSRPAPRGARPACLRIRVQALPRHGSSSAGPTPSPCRAAIRWIQHYFGSPKGLLRWGHRCDRLAAGARFHGLLVHR